MNRVCEALKGAFGASRLEGSRVRVLGGAALCCLGRFWRKEWQIDALAAHFIHGWPAQHVLHASCLAPYQPPT